MAVARPRVVDTDISDTDIDSSTRDAYATGTNASPRIALAFSSSRFLDFVGSRCVFRLDAYGWRVCQKLPGARSPRKGFLVPRGSILMRWKAIAPVSVACFAGRATPFPSMLMTSSMFFALASVLPDLTRGVRRGDLINVPARDSGFPR